MKRLNILFIIYMIIGISYIPLSTLAETHMQSLVLISSGYISYILSAVGYALNGGK